MLVHDYFEDSRRRFPDKVAVTHELETLTYGELGRFSDNLGTRLTENGVTGHRVAFWMKRRPSAVGAILGILKSANAYVPLDPESPPLRVAQVLSDCAIRALVVDEHTVSKVPAVLEQYPGLELVLAVGTEPPAGKVRSIVVDASPGPVKLPDRPTDREPAYIFYTSGSTGKPKGVMISHHNVVNFVEWAVRFFGITGEDRLTNPTPLFFDLSTFDIHGTFAAGATLHMISERQLLSPKAVLEWIEKERVTIWFSVPSVLTFLNRMKVLKPGLFPSLRAILWCGEVFSSRDLADWMRVLPGKVYANLYGPTETTVASTVHVFTEPPSDLSKPPTIGRPRDNVKALILDESGRPLGPGQVGELCLGGNAVMHGYWRLPERTQSVLIQNPGHSDYPDLFYRTGDLACWEADGTISLKGRKDHQIKSRGYRIELGDIEAAFTAHPGIGRACAVAYEDQEFGNARIKVYYTGEVTPAEVMGFVKQHLPPYMLPHKMERLNEMPELPNGKVDRAACRNRPY